MDRRVLPVAFRPSICRAKPLAQNQQEIEPKITEAQIAALHAPEPTKSKKGKKAAAPENPLFNTQAPPPTPSVEAIKLNIRRRNG